MKSNKASPKKPAIEWKRIDEPPEFGHLVTNIFIWLNNAHSASIEAKIHSKNKEKKAYWTRVEKQLGAVEYTVGQGFKFAPRWIPTAEYKRKAEAFEKKYLALAEKEKKKS